MFTKKVEKIWEDNKEVICLVGGACLIIVGSKYLKHMKRLSTLNHLIKKEEIMVMKKAVDPRFPNDMPISEIKEALDKITGAQYSDALVTFVDGKRTLYVR